MERKVMMNHNEYFEKAKNGELSETPSLSLFLKCYYADLYEELEEEAYCEELCQDLFGRAPELLEALEWFCENGYTDFDDTDEKDVSLEDAIMEADAPMVEYLILHGANPLTHNCEITNNNFYMEDLDVQIFNLRGSEHFNAILQTARILAKSGVTYGSYLNIEIDKKERTIRIHSPKYKY